LNVLVAVQFSGALAYPENVVGSMPVDVNAFVPLAAGPTHPMTRFKKGKSVRY
jgi:hypothetical protein